ncbi:hypothetical protein HY933_03440 [Candidatus Falkowbacteria bacterium]|nr:hypothetical protein [Candidatus Falkowbacteria bacterium]
MKLRYVTLLVIVIVVAVFWTFYRLGYTPSEVLAEAFYGSPGQVAEAEASETLTGTNKGAVTAQLAEPDPARGVPEYQKQGFTSAFRCVDTDGENFLVVENALDFPGIFTGQFAKVTAAFVLHDFNDRKVVLVIDPDSFRNNLGSWLKDAEAAEGREGPTVKVYRQAYDELMNGLDGLRFGETYYLEEKGFTPENADGFAIARFTTIP